MNIFEFIKENCDTLMEGTLAEQTELFEQFKQLNFSKDQITDFCNILIILENSEKFTNKIMQLICTE